MHNKHAFRLIKKGWIRNWEEDPPFYSSSVARTEHTTQSLSTGSVRVIVKFKKKIQIKNTYSDNLQRSSFYLTKLSPSSHKYRFGGPGSRGQKRHHIPDPDPQQCIKAFVSWQRDGGEAKSNNNKKFWSSLLFSMKETCVFYVKVFSGLKPKEIFLTRLYKGLDPTSQRYTNHKITKMFSLFQGKFSDNQWKYSYTYLVLALQSSILYNVNHKSYSLFWCYRTVFKLKLLLTTLLLVNEATRGHVKQQREGGGGGG